MIKDTKPKIWFHGYMHDNFDYHVDDTRVICNPKGYVNYYGEVENPYFNEYRII